MNIKNVFVLFLILTTFLYAETHFLNLEKCLDIAMDQSYNMKVLKENMLQAELELKATTNGLKTNISLNMTTPDYKESMQRFEDSLGVYYTPIKQAIYNSNLYINQRLFTDGKVYIRSGFYSTTDYFTDKNTLQLNTRIGFEQPIEAFYYNKLRSSIKNAKLSYERFEKRLKRENLNLKYEVSQLFYNLVSSQEQEKIAKQDLESRTSANTLGQNKFKAGVIAEVEALQMEIDLAEAENSYFLAVASTKSKEDVLKQLLGIDLNDKLELDYNLNYTKVYVDENDAIERGLKNRLEIRESEISKEIAEINLRQTKSNGRIKGTIHGYYDFIGVGSEDIDIAYKTTIDRTWENLTGKKGNRGISLNISIPIWDWGVNKAKVNAAKAEIRKADYAIKNAKVDVQRDIRNTIAELESALRGLEILEKTVAVAEKSFEISTKRFSNGDISSQNLALDRDRLNKVYKSRLTAFINYKLSLADLTRKTFYDYEMKQAIND